MKTQTICTPSVKSAVVFVESDFFLIVFLLEANSCGQLYLCVVVSISKHTFNLLNKCVHALK